MITKFKLDERAASFTKAKNLGTFERKRI